MLLLKLELQSKCLTIFKLLLFTYDLIKFIVQFWLNYFIIVYNSLDSQIFPIGMKSALTTHNHL